MSPYSTWFMCASCVVSNNRGCSQRKQSHCECSCTVTKEKGKAEPCRGREAASGKLLLPVHVLSPHLASQLPGEQWQQVRYLCVPGEGMLMSASATGTMRITGQISCSNQCCFVRWTVPVLQTVCLKLLCKLAGIPLKACNGVSHLRAVNLVLNFPALFGQIQLQQKCLGCFISTFTHCSKNCLPPWLFFREKGERKGVPNQWFLVPFLSEMSCKQCWRIIFRFSPSFCKFSYVSVCTV